MTEKSSLEVMAIRMKDGRELFLQKRKGVISINGQFHERNLQEITERIVSGRWIKERKSEFVPVGSIPLGQTVVRKGGDQSSIRPVSWTLEKFPVMEVRGTDEDEKEEFLQCMGFEARNASNVFIIDPDGSSSRLPVRQWELRSGKPYGLGLFTPYGGAMKSEDDANKEKALTVEAMKGAMDITGNQLLLLKQALDKLFSNYWYQVSLGVNGHPRTPSIKGIIDYLSKLSGSSAIGLMTKLYDMQSFSEVFDAPLPSRHSTGVYSYKVLPPKLKNLATFELMRKLAKATSERLLIFNYEGLPNYKIERKLDLFGSIMEDVQSHNLRICYSLNQESPTPKWIKENYPGKILRVQLTSDLYQKQGDNSILIPKAKGFAFVRGVKAATLLSWDDLRTRIARNAEEIAQEQSLLAAQMRELEDD